MPLAVRGATGSLQPMAIMALVGEPGCLDVSQERADLVVAALRRLHVDHVPHIGE